jgi:hypothetical protein
MNSNQVQVDANGNWNFKVPENLSPGTYTIILKGTDSLGNPVEKPYTFTISSNASVSDPLPSTGVTSTLFMITGLFLVTTVIVATFIRYRARSFEQKILEN